ncbi:GAF domain-containing protein [Coleofasciculus sp. FACHB-64]|uniref:adenylate/guanylate cyclase domain-containing protein n=1 Tax=Cyanophyceae TaxID=3028117 RepID=UPI001683867B|nr:adenylate/guanylate cyclase domain-containing protein [Coleofasciculus sp. FACHB-64]MBD2046432.1 GAF domain-containing protein [Coleofasciculus sp. FACHB-64]
MTLISLKKLISKKEISSLIANLIETVDSSVSIIDVNGSLLIGDGIFSSPNKFPIQLSEEVIGWVFGGDKASSLASLLTYIAGKEVEKKTLAREVLDRYKEINLLYNISGKLSACLDLKEIAKLVIDEARRLIKTTNASAMLLNEKTGKLEIIAAFGQEYQHKTTLFPGEGIAGSVFHLGNAEIVNDVESDSRFITGNNKIKSLICAPLKTQNVVLGVLNLSSDELVNYTAQDLKLFTALASQAAAAIENALLHENKLREARIKSNLERYVPAQVVEAILDPQEDISLVPAKKDISILFSDIRNFTTKCEELAPEAIVEYLNEYFTHMVEVIFSHGGTVNKFVGDMIVAMFGAPSTLVDSERRAIETAIEMQKRIKTIPVAWIRDNFLTGIGISSGEVVVGNVGSPQHMDYTAIGDKVNIASRLQSMAKGEQILVSRSIYESTKHLFEFKEIGSVQVKGKKEAVEVFEVLY